MNTHADKTQENKSRSVSATGSQMQSGGKSTFQFVDNRPEAIAQRKLQEMANNSPQVSQLRAFQKMLNPQNDGALNSTHAIQLYRTSRQAGQDGQFIPAFDSAIHCHIGGRMRNPHLKISGDRRSPYNFGNPHDSDRMQAAYNALVSGGNERLAGYADCVEYLEEQGCVAADVDEEIVEGPPAPLSAYDDPRTSRESRRLIEEGLSTGYYPPRR
jgi:hypothetical protein